MKSPLRQGEVEVLRDGRLRVAAQPTYNVDTGERDPNPKITIFHAGPRGGRYPVWSGSPADAEAFAALLKRAATAAITNTAARADWAP